MTIPIYTDINVAHAATGFSGRTDLPDCHIFTLEESYPSTRAVMPPHRLGFFQLTLFENSPSSRLQHDVETLSDLDNLLTVASPDHVLSWVRGGTLSGFVLYFKAAFLSHLAAPVAELFPYFDLRAINALYLESNAYQKVREELLRLHETFDGQHPYRRPLLQAELTTLLFRCRHYFDQRQAALAQLPPAHRLVYQLRQAISQHYLHQKKVEEYAQWLGVSADYLGKVVRQSTGKTPLALIHERILLEAQRLLRHSDLSAAEISDFLGFPAASHFGRFFRRQTGQAPIAWRINQLHGN